MVDDRVVSVGCYWWCEKNWQRTQKRIQKVWTQKVGTKLCLQKWLNKFTIILLCEPYENTIFRRSPVQCWCSGNDSSECGEVTVHSPVIGCKPCAHPFLSEHPQLCILKAYSFYKCCRLGDVADGVKKSKNKSFTTFYILTKSGRRCYSAPTEQRHRL